MKLLFLFVHIKNLVNKLFSFSILSLSVITDLPETQRMSVPTMTLEKASVGMSEVLTDAPDGLNQDVRRVFS